MSSVVLVSSLSSALGERRSGSGRWATGPADGIRRHVDLGVDDLSAAHWELTELERDLKARGMDGVGGKGWGMGRGVEGWRGVGGWEWGG